MNEHRFYMDTEFVQYKAPDVQIPTLDLISIGLVDENDQEFYRINADCCFANSNDWVKKHVLKPMGISVEPWFGNEVTVGIDCLHPDNDMGWYGVNTPSSKWRDRQTLVQELREFIDTCSGKATPVFYTYYGAYDWVIFCDLFGCMLDLPKGYPMYTRDLKQIIDDIGLDVKDTTAGACNDNHNALGDAKWNKDLHAYILLNYETIHKRI